MPCSASFGYLEAWSLWLDGQSVQSACLGKWSILWLARIGKIASAIAGTVIVVDILGEQRMQDFGTKILGRYGTWEYKLATAGVAIPLALLATVFATLWSIFSKGMDQINADGAGSPMIIIYQFDPIVGFMALIFGLLAFMVGSLLSILILSHILAMPRVGTILRTTSLVLFCGGFHFDLLAS